MAEIIYWAVRILSYAGLTYFGYAALKAKEPKARNRSIFLAAVFAVLAFVFIYVVQIAYVLS